jgi:excisionase family DNA binding protein
MQNPFDEIIAELKSIKAMIATLPINSVSPPSEIGGLQLAEEVTRLSKPRIYALVSNRSIPHSKRGNRLYFNRAELLAWVAAGSREQQKTR